MFNTLFLEYATLFLLSFAAATIFPFQSEIALTGMLLSDRYTWLLLVIVASAGNTLGSVMNWALGRYIVHFQNRRWFPVKPDMLKRAEGYYHKYGKWSLLLSWVPIIGDPLTVVAGVLREKLSIFILFVAIAKTGRYLAIAGLIKGWM